MRNLSGIETMFVLQFSFAVFLFSSGPFLYPYFSIYPLKYAMGMNIELGHVGSSFHAPYLEQFKVSTLFH